jgi:hypothetical protein
MKAPTKAELKDRIANAEKMLNAYKKDYIDAVLQKTQWQVEADIARMEAKRATIAAYALLATLTVIICWSVI